MKKTMIGYRGIEYKSETLISITPTELGFEISKMGKGLKETKGTIFFKTDDSSCIVQANGTLYAGVFVLDNKAMLLVYQVLPQEELYYMNISLKNN